VDVLGGADRLATQAVRVAVAAEELGVVVAHAREGGGLRRRQLERLRLL